VLDNCEHLVDTVARIADLIVHRCPAVTVLATSQEGLGVAAEVTFGVRPLPQDEAERLFVERASAARHSFAVNAESSPAVQELCRRLDGIPLAIELAAARVASMNPAAILERIDERFRLLGHRRRTARPRHQTLRAALDWSYGLLAEPEQLVFDRLAVFAGSFTMQAAEVVVAADGVDARDVLDLVSSLVAKSMVQLDERAVGDRYRLLETMREYGLERLAGGGDLDAIQRRHAAHYLSFAEETAPHLFGADESVWFDRVDDDLPNLRAALSYLRDHDHAAYCRLTGALSHFWWTVGLFREGLDWLTSALAVGSAEPSQERAESLAIAGDLAMVLDRYDEGFALLDESLACSAAAGATPSAMVSYALAMAALVQNRPDDACRFSEDAVELARAHGDPYELGRTLSFAGLIIGLSVESSRGLELSDEAVTIARGLGNSHLLAMTMQGAGVIRSQVDPATALELLSQSFVLTGDRYRRATATGHSWKAVAHLMLRQYTDAAAELCIALPLVQEGGEPYQLATALAISASLLARPQPDIAIRLLALLDRLRDDGTFIGASRDLAIQTHLRSRLQERLDPTHFATLWAGGRTITLDDGVALALDELARLANSK
jgi:predicted ATPase